jgi:hypothetical protein
MSASNVQVQNFSDQVARPLSEQARALYLSCKAFTASFTDLYNNLTSSPTWIDGRTDGPPHLAAPSDLLAFNTFAVGFIAFIENGSTATMSNGSAQYPVVQNLCVRSVIG